MAANSGGLGIGAENDATFLVPHVLLVTRNEAKSSCDTAQLAVNSGESPNLRVLLPEGALPLLLIA